MNIRTLAVLAVWLATVPAALTQTGIVVAFASDKIPDGWAICDGRSVSKDDPKYKSLFEVIGTIHGGDANPNFQLPDYRGLFLRGVDRGAGRDLEAGNRRPPGRNNTGNTGPAIGSLQDDNVGNHSHTIPGFHLEADGGSGFHGAGLDTNSNRNHPMTHDYGTSGVSTSGTLTATESRPKNAYVNYIIKL